MDANPPVYLGKISDVVDGKINTGGFAFIHALMSPDELHGKADVYDRPYGAIQLWVEPHGDGAIASVWDLQNAIDAATESAKIQDSINGGSGFQARARQVIRYASAIAAAPKAMRVT